MNRVEVIDVGIEPQIVLVRRNDDGHAIVQVGDERIRSRGQDRTALDDLPVGTLPLIPKAGERKDIAFTNFKTVRLLH